MFPKLKNPFFKTNFRSILYSFNNLSPIKRILLFYLFITFAGSALLMLPISQIRPGTINYIDALFTSASAFSDTGLVTLKTAFTWTIFGQAIIAILILNGGIGIFAIKVAIFNIFFKSPTSLISRTALANERGNKKIGEVTNLIKVAIISILITLTLSSIILSFYFYFADSFHQATNMGVNPYQNWNVAIRYGVFQSISAINNAGFDIIGQYSLAPYFNDYFVQIVLIFLFVFGGIGYPVIYDLWHYFKSKKQHRQFKFSLFTKISCLAYLLISLIGISLTFLIELNLNSPNTFWNMDKLVLPNQALNEHQTMTTSNKTMALIFNTLSTRNAGFSTIDIHNLSEPTQIIHSVMMFIGSAPSSTAGGIKTTTFALILMAFWSKLRGKTFICAFKKRINFKVVHNALIAALVSIMIVFIATLVVSTSLNLFNGQIEQQNGLQTQTKTYNFTNIFFEVNSAFGTTGLSTGLTNKLNTTSKLVIILLMFIGQLGITNTIFSFSSKKNYSKNYEYIEEDLIIG